MATNTSYAKLIREAESLQGSCLENKPALEGIDPLLEKLDASVGALKSLKTRQEQMEGSRQETTQLLQQAAEQLREVVRQVRSFVKSLIGTKNERLPQFGVAPIRSRSRRRPAVKQPVHLQVPVPVPPESEPAQ